MHEGVLYPPQTLFVVGILFSRCPCVRVCACVRACVRPSVHNQGSHGQGKVSEKRKKFKVREKSGNFELSQGNWKFWRKSGKSQGIL